MKTKERISELVICVIIKLSIKSTDTYKPSGNFIYDDKSLMNMTDKFKV